MKRLPTICLPENFHEFPFYLPSATASLNEALFLGKKEDGKYTISASAPEAILAEDVDASTEDKQAVAYLTGEFNKTALKANAEIDTLIPKLRAKSIFVKENQAY